MRETFLPSTHPGTPAHRAQPQPTRARLLSELYLRAYWRYYLFAALWVVFVTLILPIR